MNDQQPYSRLESEEEHSMSPGRRRVSRRAFSGLVVTLLVVVAAALTSILVSCAGAELRGAQQESAQASPEVTGADQSPGPQAELPAGSPSGPESELTSPDPRARVVPETVEPTATRPRATATATVIVEPTATDPAPTEPSPADEAPDLGDGRIAIVDTQRRLWTVAPDGSDRRLLSERGRFFQFPSWSPSGNDIAVIGTDSEGGVYVVTDEREGEMRQLYSDATDRPIYLYWSPEGDSVSFIASYQGGLALHLARKDGSKTPELVATSPSTFFWDWVPDGSQVLIHTGFSAYDSDNARLAFIPLDSTPDATEIAQTGYFQTPVVASDGRYYGYSDEDPDGRRWLNVWDIAGDQQVERVFHQGVVAMSFSPTKAQLAYTSPVRAAHSFYGPLRLLDLESDEARLLVSEIVLAYFWSPDGRTIAYLTLTELDDPFDFDDAPVATFPGQVKTLVLSELQHPPDEESRFGLALSVIDVDSGETRRLTVFEPGDEFLDQFLPFFDQYALSHRLWSPDSQALVMPIKDENGRDLIVVVPVDGSEPVTIAQGVAAFWSQQ